MKKIMLIAAAILICACSGMHKQPMIMDKFITREGPLLMEGDKPFRFAGIHAPELHRIEDDSRGVCAEDPRGWGQYFKWPTEREQENWIKALTGSGHKAMRVYVLSVATPWDEACDRETHILPPTEESGMPRLNEAAFVVYDRMIALSEKYGLRLILPFIDHWEWWGGRKQLAAFYGESEGDFYSVNSKTYAAYQSIIHQVITRQNTITKRKYRDEPSIMAWETGNELRESSPEFVRTTSAFIKSLDRNHLVVDGTYLKIIPESLDDPNVDIISNHFYTVNGNNKPEQVKTDLARIDGRKAYMVGEFGLLPAKQMRDIMQTVVHYQHDGARAVGVFVWGFRGHREEGGFYWHKEYTGHYSYHLPGFADNDNNEELAVISLVREAQAHIAGRDILPLPVPEPPLLHPIVNPAKDIRWMGAPLGQSYRVERASSAEGPWTIVGSGISDGRNEFNPATDTLFTDPALLDPGIWYYRVIAVNETGESMPSNIVAVAIP
jgi:Endo-beta-mannanase